MAQTQTKQPSWLETAGKTALGVGFNALTGGLGSAISGLAGNFLGGLFGSSDAEKTAQMQLQIARETNANSQANEIDTLLPLKWQ